MLKKHYRDIRFVKITLQHKRDNSSNNYQIFRDPINGNDPLTECLSVLKNQHDENPKNFIKLFSKGRICRALRKFQLLTNDNVATLLWGVGDKDTVDPCFWDESTDITREEHAKDTERVACTSHFVINLEYLPQIAGYIGCIEEVPNLSISVIESMLNGLFNRFVQINTDDNESDCDNQHKKISINIEILASHGFDEAMRGGRMPFEIIAETSIEKDDFDENFVQTERKQLKIKTQIETPLDVFKEAFNRFRKEHPDYRKYTIRYKEHDRTDRAMSVEVPDEVDADIDSCLFIHRDRLNLTEPIKQFCEDIHPNLNQKMKEYLITEQRYLREHIT